MNIQTDSVFEEVTLGLSREVITKNRPMLEAYTFAIAAMRDAERRVKDEGLIVADAKGVPVEHPALAIQRKQSAEVEKFQKCITMLRRQSEQ